MELEALIRGRRSIRRFNQDPVQEALVVDLLNAAQQNVFEEPAVWRCLYAGTADSRKRLADYMLEQMSESRLGKLIPGKMLDIFKKRFIDIPAHLIVIAGTAPDRGQSDSNYAAVCSIMQNFQLLGWEQGLGMLWDTEAMIQNEAFFKSIGVGKDERFVGIFHMGYFDKAPRGRSRIPAEKKWTVLQGDVFSPDAVLSVLPVQPELVLELLNHAVWAPNDGLRQPWRFIFTGYGDGEVMPGQATASAYLVVVMNVEADHNKRIEDFAAVCCLIQNFRLLAEEKRLGVKQTMHAWIYDRDQTKPLGVQETEQIVAVLELGMVEQMLKAGPVANMPELAFELL